MHELVDVVDENDCVIGIASKKKKNLNEFISRNIAVFLKDSSGNLLIAKRSFRKKSFPGMLDASVVGNVRAGESYEQAAERELREELGVSSCKLSFLGKVFNERVDKDGRKFRYFTGIFSGEYSGEIRLNDEIIEIKRMPVQLVEELINSPSNNFTPFFINDFKFARKML